MDLPKFPSELSDEEYQRLERELEEALERKREHLRGRYPEDWQAFWAELSPRSLTPASWHFSLRKLWQLDLCDAHLDMAVMAADEAMRLAELDLPRDPRARYFMERFMWHMWQWRDFFWAMEVWPAREWPFPRWRENLFLRKVDETVRPLFERGELYPEGSMQVLTLAVVTDVYLIYPDLLDLRYFVQECVRRGVKLKDWHQDILRRFDEVRTREVMEILKAKRWPDVSYEHIAPTHPFWRYAAGIVMFVRGESLDEDGTEVQVYGHPELQCEVRWSVPRPLFVARVDENGRILEEHLLDEKAYTWLLSVPWDWDRIV